MSFRLIRALAAPTIVLAAGQALAQESTLIGRWQALGEPVNGASGTFIDVLPPTAAGARQARLLSVHTPQGELITMDLRLQCQSLQVGHDAPAVFGPEGGFRTTQLPADWDVNALLQSVGTKLVQLVCTNGPQDGQVPLRDARELARAYVAARTGQPSSAAQASTRPSSAPAVRTPPNIPAAQRLFGAALEGATYHVSEGNPPGRYRYVGVVSACVTRHVIDMPARTIGGRAWDASTADYTIDWSRILSAELTPRGGLRIPSRANSQYAVSIAPGHQAAALVAARYLIERCAAARPTASQ